MRSKTKKKRKKLLFRFFILVGTGGFEPLTSATRTQRSTRLNYVPSDNEYISTQKKFRLQAFFSHIRKKN